MRVNVHLQTVPHLRLSFTADTNELTKLRTTRWGGFGCVYDMCIKNYYQIINYYYCLWLLLNLLQPLLCLGLLPKSSHPREQDIHIYPVSSVLMLSWASRVASYFCLSVSYSLHKIYISVLQRFFTRLILLVTFPPENGQSATDQ